jgi:drug/metabolite transporter (DMT)-like permease
MTLSREFSSMHRKLVPYLEALTVALIWAASSPIIKILLEDLSPFEIAILRYVSAFLLFVPLLFFFSRGNLRVLNTQDWLRLSIMGIVGFAIGSLSMFKGLEKLDATTSAFLLNGIPILTFLLGATFLKERPTSWQWLGLVVALAGGFVFFGIRVGLDDVYSIVLTLFGVIAYTIDGLIGRSIAREKKVDTLTLAALPMGIGGFALLSISPVQALPPRSTWGIMLWLIVPSSMLAFIIWNHARRKLKAFEMSITLNLIPIGTALISPWLIGETMPGRAWIGMLVTLVGVLLVGFTEKPTSEWVAPGKSL